jgi:hypothetical protein
VRHVSLLIGTKASVKSELDSLQGPLRSAVSQCFLLDSKPFGGLRDSLNLRECNESPECLSLKLSVKYDNLLDK